jgi:cobalt/nickel transport protein
VKPVWIAVVVLAIIGLFAVPLILAKNGDPDKTFMGTDDRAQEAIKERNPEYVRWAKPLWSPPSTEVESGIFAIQAAAGAGVLGYVIGYLRGKASRVGKPDAHV